MSRGWSVPEFLLDPEAVLLMGGPYTRFLPFRHQFGPDNRDFPRSIDAQAHLAAFETYNSYADVLPDEEFFHQLPRQHQHVTLPLLSPVVGSYPRRVCIPMTHDPQRSGSLPRV
jgi:hypothetical protein